MNRVYFLGAGASVPDGYPVTAWLSAAVAAFLEDYRAARGRPSRLEQYLVAVYGLNRHLLSEGARRWKNYTTDRDAFAKDPVGSELPSIIELLSIIDMAIADGSSFGPSIDGTRTREFRGNELVRVRDRIVEALVRGFSQVQENRRASGHPVAENFVRGLAGKDVVITTNWDTLVEEAVRTHRPDTDIEYGADLVTVDRYGRRANPAAESQRVLKLHGSFSWLHCPCCQNLYANQDLIVTPEISIERWPLDTECDCGAELTGTLVAPTFFKSYRMPQLAEIWRLAQKALEASAEWIFAGYSLPLDDLWIRGLLLRAIALRRRRAQMPKITVVCRGEDPALRERFQQLLRGAEIGVMPHGFAAFAAQMGSPDTGHTSP